MQEHVEATKAIQIVYKGPHCISSFALRTPKMPEANNFNADVEILNLAIDMVRHIILVRFV